MIYPESQKSRLRESYRFINSRKSIENVIRPSPPFKRAEEEGGRLHPIDDGLREEQSMGTEWQNLYLRREIMVSGMGLKGDSQI